MTNNEVREWIQYACDCNGRPDIAASIKLVWSNRMTKSMGIAAKRGGAYTIKLSAKLFGRATCEQRRDTVIHEACHVIDGIVNKVRMSHGRGWKACMVSADCEPSRYHTVSTAGLVRRFVYTCRCDTVFRVTPNMHSKITRGSCRVCKKCKGVIEYTGKVEG